MSIKLETLMSLPIFAGIDEDLGSILADNCQFRRCLRGQLLFIHGDPISHLFIIYSGVFQVFHETLNGHEVTSNIATFGDCLNVDEIISTQAMHLWNARAIEDSNVIEIPIQWMREHLDLANLSPLFLENISARLNRSQKEAEQLSTMSAAQIVACYLQEICATYALTPVGFELPFTKTLIASRLHMELATFSRTLKKLKSWGIIVKGTHVSVTNMEKIRYFVCDTCSTSESCHARRALDKLIKQGADKPHNEPVN